MFSFVQAFFRSTRGKQAAKLDDEEAAPLLVDDHSQENDQSSVETPPPRYGSTDTVGADQSENTDLDSADKTKLKQEEEGKPKEAEQKPWFAYIRQFAVFLPYIWPSRNLRLQLHLVGIALCLVAIRFLNVLAPRQLSIVVDKFAKSPTHVPVSDLLLYLFFDWLTSSSITGAIKDYLWVAVEQNAHKTIVTKTFNHIMALSCNFHDNKKSGELYMAMRQGNSIYSLFETAFFDLAPRLVDLVVACVYLSYLFGTYMALLVGTTMIMYLCALKYLAAMRVDSLRRQTELGRKAYQVMCDALGGWISVAYFGNFEYEKERYKAAVEVQLQAQFKFLVLLYMARFIQASILDVGLAAAAFLAAYQVSTGKIAVGGFVLLLNLWARFTGKISKKNLCS